MPDRSDSPQATSTQATSPQSAVPPQSASTQEVREDWAERFRTQSEQCGQLGSPLYMRLLRIIGDDVETGGATWDVIAPSRGLRYGQAGPLRLLAGAHLLALSGEATEWASKLPSCGGRAPDSDVDLRGAWLSLVDTYLEELQVGMNREVQTNEVARSGPLAMAIASTGFDTAALIEVGCSGGLNMRMDRYATDLGGTGSDHVPLGDPDSIVTLSPEMRSPVQSSLRLPAISSRTGIDPHPIDASTDEGRWSLMSFLWPDQTERIARLAAATEIARAVPVDQIATEDTVGVIADLLERGGPRVIQHSIVWQYIPTSVRWRLTETIESAGHEATSDAPLAWIRYEPDEWNRSRAALWMRTWPQGGDRLLAHVDFHGRWIDPI